MTASTQPNTKLLVIATELPAGPRILALLGRRLFDLNTDLAVIADLIRCDPALTARIVRIANSVAYGGQEPIASLEEALARVGFVEVYRLTGFIAVAQVGESDLPFYGITGAQFRENSLLTALLMEQLAEEAQLDAQAAYTAGLLRSIGKVALNRLAARTGKTVNYELEGRGPIAAWEIESVGMTNGEAAAQILKEWRFPAETIAAISEQYAPPPEARLAGLLNIAAGAAERCGHGLPGEFSYWGPAPEVMATVGIAEGQIEEATHRALQKFGPVRSAVG